ncbi:hypothetical protein AXG93_2145s1240 [Marchantia polymorpha subsp. ruderalis]|uniref:Uncharacterized protein n=1 Tax=Marchantia polymorpha subsp. ruderalis TaxID=1480154 RepID=A0A176W048_MARPO|nr:hypothetical protein AXG93_2145s1240 [Marchantia polymorpha subsp. ruderalis]
MEYKGQLEEVGRLEPEGRGGRRQTEKEEVCQAVASSKKRALQQQQQQMLEGMVNLAGWLAGWLASTDIPLPPFPPPALSSQLSAEPELTQG